eukprot:s310_g6.t1
MHRRPHLMAPQVSFGPGTPGVTNRWVRGFNLAVPDEVRTAIAAGFKCALQGGCGDSVGPSTDRWLPLPPILPEVVAGAIPSRSQSVQHRVASTTIVPAFLPAYNATVAGAAIANEPRCQDCFKVGSLSSLGSPGDSPKREGPERRHPWPLAKRQAFSDTRYLLAARVAIFPETLDRPELRDQPLSCFHWYAGHRLSGAGAPGARDRCAVFLTREHLQLRTLPCGWSLNDLTADLLGAFPRLQSIRIMQDRLDQLPPTQVILTMRDDPPACSVMPLDFRKLQGRLCTVALRDGVDFQGVVDQSLQDCPPERLPRSIFQLQSSGGSLFRRLHLRDIEPDFLLAVPFELPVEAPEAAGPLVSDSDGLPEDAEHDQPALLQSASPTILKRTPSDPLDGSAQPPALLGKLMPSALAGFCAGSIKILPEYLGTMENLGKEVLHSSWGGRAAAEAGQFAVFDVVHQVRVLNRGTKSTVHECVALALQATDFLIAHVRVLTVPVPGLPLPQLVLHRADDHFPLDTLVWDLRAIQRPIRTVAHIPGTAIGTAVQQVEMTAMQELGLLAQWQAGSVVILDALGVLEEELPDDFDQAQHLRAEFTLSFGAASMSIEEWPARGPPRPTTSTTTAMHGHLPTRPPRFHVSQIRALEVRVIWGRHSEQAVVELPCTQVDRVLDFLLRRLEHAHEPLSGQQQLMLIKAQPHSDTAVFEAIFLVLETGQVLSVFDTRHLGQWGTLFSASCPTGVRCEFTVQPEVLAGGWALFVNGAPVHLCQRNVDNGDFFQLCPAERFPQHVPTTVILEVCPMLEAFAWGLNLPVVRHARVRRAQAGFHRHIEGRCLVMGPEHSPAVFRTQHAFVASVAEMREAAAELTGFPARDCAIVRVSEQFRNEQITTRFASIARASTLSTVMLPAWGWEDHFVVLLVPPKAETLGPLPIGHNMLVLPVERWTPGLVIRIYLAPTTTSTTVSPPPEDTAGEADCSVPDTSPAAASTHQPEGTSLLQVRAQLRRAPANVIPTPHGRRKLPLALGCDCAASAAAVAVDGGVSARSSDLGSLPAALACGGIDEHSASPSRRTAAQPATALSLCQLVPEEDQPLEGSSLRTGVSADMFDFVFSPFSWNILRQDWRAVPGLKPVAASFLQGLNRFPATRPPDAMQIYVDGSFELSSTGAVRSGWSLCVLCRISGEWQWAGFLAATAGSGNSCTLQDPVRSAFETELAALVHALTWCVAHPCPAAIFYDSESAGGIASGMASPQRPSALSTAAAALLHLLTVQRRPPAFSHVRAHTGHPLNEFCDAVAKASAKALLSTALPDTLNQAQAEDVLPWLWTALGVSQELPAACRNGVVQDAQGDCLSGLSLRQVWPPNDVANKVQVDLRLRLVTYNALSLATVAQRESVAGQLRRRNCCVAGIQETRQEVEGRADNADFFVLASASQQGHLGVQAWFAKRAQIGWAGETPLFWDSQSFSLVEHSPRSLLVLARAGSLKFAVLVGHSPTSKESPEVRQHWWRRFSATLRRAPPSCVPLVLLDANAKEADESSKRWETSNDAFFKQFLSEHQLDHSGNADAAGRQFTSWTGPGGQSACIDFICYPRDVSAGVSVEGPLRDFQGLVDHDHCPIAVCCQWRQLARRPRLRTRLDLSTLDHAATRTQYGRLLAAMPPVAWEDNVDVHLDKIHRHMVQSLQQVCPPCSRAARNPTTSERTWVLIRNRRELRRELHARGVHARSRQLHCIFQAWKTGISAAVTDEHLAHMHDALLSWQLTAHNRLIRNSARQDSADTTRRLFQEARGRGPEALHRLFRQVTKSGRRYRRPCLAPAIRLPDGSVAEDSAKLLGDHFAVAERAISQPAEDILTGSLPAPKEVLEAVPELSLPRLAIAFGQLAKRKASGISGVPAEGFRSAPIQAASCFSSLLLKMQIRGQTPALWRGGRAVAIEKPSKPLGQLASWRSILLLEAGAKGIARALRPCLLRSFEAVRQEGQGGSRPGLPIQLPMAVCRGFIRRLKRDRVSGGIIFVDGASAFYSVLRQRLSGREGHHTQQYLEELASSLFDQEADRIRFLACALGPGLLAATDTPEPIRRLVLSSYDSSWFLIGEEDPRTYLTRSGTIPGAPLADLAFQMSFSMALQGLQERMKEAGCQAQLQAHDSLQTFTVPSPSWMDDLAVPIAVSMATEVVPKAAKVVEAVAQELHDMGVAINLGRGKSELLPYFAGPDHRQARLRWLCQDAATFPVALPNAEQGVVHIVPSYIHLGSVIDVTAGDAEDIARRRFLARDLLRAQYRLLCNPHLSSQEKVQLLLAGPIARFQHGSGLWELRLPAERAAYQAGYMELMRRSFRPITGLTCKGLTDEEVCTCLGVLSGAEARQVQLCRHAAWLRAEPSAALEELWFREGAWYDEVRSSIQVCAQAAGCDPEAALWMLVKEPHTAKHWTRAFTRDRLRKRRDRQSLLLQQWSDFARAVETGWIFLSHKAASTEEVKMFACQLCEVRCEGAAALASHMRSIHGRVARASQAASGSKCEVCCKEFWTTDRLKLHLRKNARCLNIVEAADLDQGPAIKAGFAHAWPPAMAVFGPRPFWASLNPGAPADLPPQHEVLPWPPAPRAARQCTAADLAAFAKAVLTFAVRTRPGADEVPLAYLSRNFGVAEVAKCALQAAHFLLARSAGVASTAWVYMGDLESNTVSDMLCLDAATFCQMLNQTYATQRAASIYAKRFLESWPL